MIPVIAIVGRPNVGKSTLFNKLTQSRNALVADIKGVTRDRQYGNGSFEERDYIVVDTGGFTESDTEINQLAMQQTQEAINESDIILFVVDAQVGISPKDEILAKQLRQHNKKIYLVVNKIDGADFTIIGADFYRLGFNSVYPITANKGQGIGITILLKEILIKYPAISKINNFTQNNNTPIIQLAIVGRPNVGKSTLVNRFLGEDRMIVCDEPGTTRDSIYVPFHYRETDYILIDTAGIRRQSRITDTIEKFSVIKTLQTIASSNVIIFLFNAQEGILDQDLRLLKLIIDSGKALVIAINKWDTDEYQRKEIKSELDRRLLFVNFAKIHFISALQNMGINALFNSVNQAYRSATKILATSQLNDILTEIVTTHQPPIVSGKQIKLNYVHINSYNPPTLLIYGRNTDKIPEDYQRYLVKSFCKKLKLVGTPIHIQWKNRKG